MRFFAKNMIGPRFDDHAGTVSVPTSHDNLCCRVCFANRSGRANGNFIDGYANDGDLRSLHTCRIENLWRFNIACDRGNAKL